MAEQPTIADVSGDMAASEVRACFDAYDVALLGNDVEALDHWFLDSPDVVRYGLGEELYGHHAIAAHRRLQSSRVVRPPFRRQTVTAFGPAVATVCAEFEDGDDIGRQTQTWLRTPIGWRIVCAHVSTRKAAS